MADFDPLTVPAVLKQSVRRINEEGFPKQALLDYEQALQQWMQANTANTNTRLNLVSDEVDGAYAAISTEATTRATADSALASLITTVEAEVDTVAASVVTEATARANGDSALATSITTVEAIANNGTASGAITLAAKAAPSGATAAYGWYLAAGGAFTGLEAIADTVTGSAIAITAERFYIYAGSNRMQAFGHDGTDWFLNGNLVFRSGTSGERTVSTSRGATVYDAAGTMRVRWGIWS
jgi:hypothetical protein